MRPICLFLLYTGEEAQELANEIINNFGDTDTSIDLDSLGLKNVIQVCVIKNRIDIYGRNVCLFF